MIKVSACLITLNEEKNLPRALRSLQGIADEIVVVDCGSTDRTREIAGNPAQRSSRAHGPIMPIRRISPRRPHATTGYFRWMPTRS